MVDKKFYERFKELTGYNHETVAKKFSITRQRVHDIKQNYSKVYRTSFAYMVNVMIDEKIRELMLHIEELNELKRDILNDVLEGQEQEAANEGN